MRNSNKTLNYNKLIQTNKMIINDMRSIHNQDICSYEKIPWHFKMLRINICNKKSKLPIFNSRQKY